MTKEEFKTAYDEFVVKAKTLAYRSLKEGILSLSDAVDTEKSYKRDFFHYGLEFVVDGFDAQLIDKILSNIIEQEKDEYEHKLKIIQKEALLGIQAGYNMQVLHHLMNSYTEFAERIRVGDIRLMEICP